MLLVILLVPHSFSTQGGVNCFLDGYDATTEDSPQEEDRFRHYGQMVPAGVYGWGG